MMKVDVGFEELLETRKNLISKIRNELTPGERKFLLSVKKKEPDWSLIGLEGIEQLPAVQWKLINLNKMPEEKYFKALDQLEKVLEL